MLSEIELDVLRYLDRAALERLQIYSCFLRDLVNRNARALPLRYIHDVNVIYSGVYIRLLEEDRHWLDAAAPGEQELELLFHRVNNAFVYRLRLSFCREVLPLPYYLRANADDLQCRLGTLQIAATAVRVDYALVDFLGVKLQPRTYDMYTYTGVSCADEYVTLFAHDALRGSVKHLVYSLNESGLPECIIPELFRAAVVESCTISTEVDPRPWIGKFVQTFEEIDLRAGARSVTLLYTRVGKVSPLRYGVHPLVLPRRTDAPAPHSAFIKEWAQNDAIGGHSTTESTVAELYVFENAKSAKKLQVFVWTLSATFNHRQISLNYAFLLQVVDM